MFLNLGDLADNSALQADLRIVGAGPAGIALAWEFRFGAQVIVLESGRIHLDEAAQTLNRGEVVGLPFSGIAAGCSRAVGGTSKLWAGQCLRLEAIDFKHRTWVPHSGWPFSVDHLAPYYQRAETFFKIQNETYDETVYSSFGLSPPEWQAEWLYSHFTIYTPEVDTGRAHFKTLKRSFGIRVISDATVVGIDIDIGGDSVRAVHARSLSGRSCKVSAKAVILCAGGLENARILLSSDHQRRGGLGNSYDLVGRFFQEYANGLVAELVGGDLQNLQDYFRLLYRKPFRYFPKFALSEQRQRQAQVLNCNAHLVFDYNDDPTLEIMRNLLRAIRRRQASTQLLPGIGQLARNWRSLARAVRRRYRGLSPDGRPSAVRVQCYLEQAPNPDSRVQLSTQRDALGQRRLKLDWKLTSFEFRTLQVMVSTIQTEFARLNLGRIVPESWVEASTDAWQAKVVDGFHHAGTTRMADGPQDGVVDLNCEVFDTKNLYVCGGSVFPTSGYANPTLTIVALAIRLADHLRTKYKLS